MTDAPERIHAWPHYRDGWRMGKCSPATTGPGPGAEYVRADLYAGALAERDALAAAHKPTEAAMLEVAQAMHRRAQKAEGLLARMHRFLARWERVARRDRNHTTIGRIAAAARATRGCSGASFELAYADWTGEMGQLSARITDLEGQIAEAAQEARRKALKEAIEVCLSERGDPPKILFNSDAEEGWFDGAQARADAIRAMMEAGE